jgi:hypothetical protein
MSSMKIEWLSCYLFLNLNCNTPVVQAALHFQILKSFDLLKGQKLALSHLKSKLKNWEYDEKEIVWRNDNGNEICMSNIDVDIWSRKDGGPFYQSVEVLSDQSYAVLSLKQNSGPKTLRPLLLGAFAQQIRSAIDDLVEVCNHQIPMIYTNYATTKCLVITNEIDFVKPGAFYKCIFGSLG